MSTQLDTFNQYLAEKEKNKDEREEIRIQAMQEIKELEMKKHEFEMRKEEQQIMTMDISHLDPQMKAYYTMRKNEIFAKRSSNMSNPNFYFPHLLMKNYGIMYFSNLQYHLFFAVIVSLYLQCNFYFVMKFHVVFFFIFEYFVLHNVKKDIL